MRKNEPQLFGALDQDAFYVVSSVQLSEEHLVICSLLAGHQSHISIV